MANELDSEKYKDALFIHSRCCTGHWELVYNEGEYILLCAECGKPADSIIKVTGPNLRGIKCECCKGEEAE
jgi:hypothetical protein